MHLVHQVGGRIRRSAPVIDDGAVREVAIDLARMHLATAANVFEQQPGPPLLRSRPVVGVIARMHQRVHRFWHEAVVDERVFLDRQTGVSALEVAGAIIAHAVAQGQVLRACRCADWVGLHEAAALDCARQGSGCEERPGGSMPPKLVEGDHPAGD
jgi:hypothetical protein